MARISTARNVRPRWIKALREKLQLIKDPSIRGHYGQAIKDKRWQLFRPKAAPKTARGFNAKTGYNLVTPQASTRNSALANGSEPSHLLRHSVILASLLNCPNAPAGGRRGVGRSTI